MRRSVEIVCLGLWYKRATPLFAKYNEVTGLQPPPSQSRVGRKVNKNADRTCKSSARNMLIGG